MDRATAFKMGIAAAAFGAMFMALWVLGGMLVQKINGVADAPIVDDRGAAEVDPIGVHESSPAPGPMSHAVDPRLSPGRGDEIASLIGGLSSEEWGIRRAAEDRLVRIGADAVPDLEQASKGADPETAWRAAEALRRIREGGG